MKFEPITAKKAATRCASRAQAAPQGPELPRPGLQRRRPPHRQATSPPSQQLPASRTSIARWNIEMVYFFNQIFRHFIWQFSAKIHLKINNIICGIWW